MKKRAGIDELKDELNLDTIPERIEAYDISQMGGKSAVGSMVVFEKGAPQKSGYRRFKIKGVDGVDDYAMLREVLERRFQHGLKERNEGSRAKHKFSAFPDLVVIDGGKGQLSVASKVLKEFELDDIEVIGLAKQEELIFIPQSERPNVLPRDSVALHILQHIRDEAHRFALSYHRTLEEERVEKVLSG